MNGHEGMLKYRQGWNLHTISFTLIRVVNHTNGF